MTRQFKYFTYFIVHDSSIYVEVRLWNSDTEIAEFAILESSILSQVSSDISKKHINYEEDKQTSIERR